MDIRRGTVKSFDSATWLSTVQLSGSLSVWLRNVPVARNIASTEMAAGRSCAVLFFDDANPADSVVVAVWG